MLRRVKEGKKKSWKFDFDGTIFFFFFLFFFVPHLSPPSCSIDSTLSWVSESTLGPKPNTFGSLCLNVCHLISVSFIISVCLRRIWSVLAFRHVTSRCPLSRPSLNFQFCHSSFLLYKSVGFYFCFRVVVNFLLHLCSENLFQCDQ